MAIDWGNPGAVFTKVQPCHLAESQQMPHGTPWICHTFLSWSATWVLSPPRLASPQVTTVPSAKTAANALKVAETCWTLFNWSCTRQLSPPHMGLPHVTTPSATSAPEGKGGGCCSHPRLSGNSCEASSIMKSCCWQQLQISMELNVEYCHSVKDWWVVYPSENIMQLKLIIPKSTARAVFLSDPISHMVRARATGNCSQRQVFNTCKGSPPVMLVGL